MTDRIQELAAQAKAAVPNGLVVDKWIEAYNQIFAELIVQEVFDLIENERYEIYQPVMTRVKEHFGVE